jgi:SAM-dependent methyltransferase
VVDGGSEAAANFDWDAFYADDTAPWNLGRPQPALIEVADSGEIRSPVLDSGCGTGEHALMLAERGHEVVGLDISPRAIEQAEAKAAERGLTATFVVGDALALDRLDRRFKTVIDCGVFHVFDDDDRVRYVRSLATVIDPGGTLHLLCFSEHTPGEGGPRRVTQGEIYSSFEEGWQVETIRAARIDVREEYQLEAAHAWLARITRIG